MRQFLRQLFTHVIARLLADFLRSWWTGTS